MLQNGDFVFSEVLGQNGAHILICRTRKEFLMRPKDVMKLGFFRGGVYLTDRKYDGSHPREAEGALRQTGQGGGDVKTEADCIWSNVPFVLL